MPNSLFYLNNFTIIIVFIIFFIPLISFSLRLPTPIVVVVAIVVYAHYPPGEYNSYKGGLVSIFLQMFRVWELGKRLSSSKLE